MNANPYQPPQTPPELSPVRRKIVFAILTILAVPAAGIAGGSACTAALTDGPRIAALPFVLGFLTVLLILYGIHYCFAWQHKPKHGWAMIGLLLATPIALVLGGLIAQPTIMPFELPNGLPRVYYYLAAGSTACTIWSLGFWLGLSGRLPKLGKWLLK